MDMPIWLHPADPALRVRLFGKKDKKGKYMPRIIVVNRDGVEREVSGEIGLSLMEAIRDNGFDELTAICGGCCSCATCHVHIDPQFSGEISPMNADEDDLLDTSADRDATSRLSCQIQVTGQLDGLKVTIAAEG
jgi:2Fe-2S ferredoxin